MDADKMAQEIQQALGEGSKPLSDRNKALAKAIVDDIMTEGKVQLLPGSVTGTAAPGSLAGGMGSGGAIIGLLGPAIALSLANALKLGPPTVQMIDLGTAIATHVMTGTVSFKPGSITGVDTNTPTNPGTTTGAGQMGTIGGLDGGAMAQLVAPGEGGKVSDQLKAMCTAIVTHIQKNAEVSFVFGSVVGVAPPGGGPLGAGAAMAGVIK